MRRGKQVLLILSVCLLAPLPHSVAELSVEAGSILLSETDVGGIREVNTGGRVDLPAVIRSGSERAVLRLDEATFIALEPGAAFVANGRGDAMHITPQAGVIVVHAHRTRLDSPGVQIDYRESRLRIHEGTIGLRIGDDAILIRMLLGGQGFEMSRDGVYLTESESPSLFMISEAATLEIADLGELIRPDQVRLNSVAVGCATLLADRLEAGQAGLRSADLGAVLESMRLVRFRMNREQSRHVLTILVNTARREWSVRVGRKVELPELIRIPEAVAPWDRAIRTWME